MLKHHYFIAINCIYDRCRCGLCQHPDQQRSGQAMQRMACQMDSMPCTLNGQEFFNSKGYILRLALDPKYRNSRPVERFNFLTIRCSLFPCWLLCWKCKKYPSDCFDTPI